jgi:hypothetical protein
MKEPHRIIDVYDGGAYETWLVVYADGRIQEHTENNGPRILRHGCEPHDEFITLDDVAKLEQRHGKRLVEKVQAALAEMKAEAYWDECRERMSAPE